ncbi:MAG: MFS transporter [Acidobacteria bacterium]|nr:MFS transporter [Acidobacteriota bacterium]
MSAFTRLLRDNANYRYTWLGQVVSEVGDHFNNIAVFSLVMATTGSGKLVSGVLLARGLAILAGGPIAGVLLDRLDRRQMMLYSDVFRAVVAISFSFSLVYPSIGLVYLLTFLLFFASPFFTSGRASILPSIASKEELHTANSLTQTTQWTALAAGTMLGGASVMRYGYQWAFVFNAISFLFSAACISRLSRSEGFRAQHESLTEDHTLQPCRDYVEGLRYIRSVPLLLGITGLAVGWATGGGAAQVLFTLFGERVFDRGPAGIGQIWGVAAVGLLTGGAIAHRLGPRLSYDAYKWTVTVVYVIHGITYTLFSQMQDYWAALLFIGVSRAAVAISSVLNMTQLLRHVADQYRGRVFSTMETASWATMMLSMSACGWASDYYSPRDIGFVSGVLSALTAIPWSIAILSGKLPEPAREGIDPDDVEVHGEPNV